MSFDIVWTEACKWWKKPLGYYRLMRARRKYGRRLVLRNPFRKGHLFGKREGYQERLYRLRNVHEGRRCFILGNSAEIRKLDLTLLREEITIGSNEIYRLFDEIGFHTSYLTITDPVFCEDRRRELKRLNGPVMIYGLDNTYCAPINDRTLFMNICRHGNAEKEFSEDCAAVTYFGHSAACVNLQLAFHLGCNPIYLIGMDTDRVPSDRELVPGTITINEENIECLRADHFDPCFFQTGGRVTMPDRKKRYSAFKTAARVMRERGRDVFSVGPDSGPDIFKRVSFRSIFAARGHEYRGTCPFSVGGSHMDQVVARIRPGKKVSRSEKYYQKAVGMCRKGKPELALGCLEKSIATNRTALACYLKASITKSLGQVAEAAEIFEDILSDGQLYVDRNVCGGAHFHLGEISFKAGKYPRAKEHFEKCLQAIPSHKKAGQYVKVIRVERTETSPAEAVEEVELLT